MRIGAPVANTELAHDGQVQRRRPLLSSAPLAGTTAQPPPLAANLLQRTHGEDGGGHRLHVPPAMAGDGRPTGA